MAKYKVVGMMSGTSLDGMDLCYCSFEQINEKWAYQLLESITIEYPNHWLKKLENAPNLSGSDLLLLHFEYGRWIGEKIKECFANKEIDFISSHGHTVFHQPNKGITFQLGHGQSIANAINHTTICDFRTADVLLGGNGAPLVPIGDQLLFGEYEACVNLGGFANISYSEKNIIKAFDICPVNIVLNYLSKDIGLKYDKDGNISKSGKLIEPLLDELNSLDFYKTSPPKSLGREWVEENIIPLIEKSKGETRDKLRTFSEHSAVQIAKTLNGLQSKKILFTGGGAHNLFLIERIKALTNKNINMPHKNVIDYKEALVFAFLGVLRMEKKTNILSSVTGATNNSSSGMIFHP